MSESPRHFLIDRVSAPIWMKSMHDPAIPEAAMHAMGEQPSWGFAIPWMYRALASPLTYEPVLRAPRNSDHIMYDGAAAYWSALLHLLVYNLGWIRPDRGMRWWYENGKPPTDERLRFISEVWGVDAQLDWFVAWLRTTARILDPWLVEEATGHVIGDDTESLLIDLWAEERLAEAEVSRIPAPVSRDGWDPLHLSRHISGPLEPVGGKVTLLRTGSSRYQAVLLLDSMIGWYRALIREGDKLTMPPGRSWHVDVVVKPVGWLGTFRRSAVTGLWFSGRHHVHMHGV